MDQKAITRPHLHLELLKLGPVDQPHRQTARAHKFHCAIRALQRRMRMPRLRQDHPPALQIDIRQNKGEVMLGFHL